MHMDRWSVSIRLVGVEMTVRDVIDWYQMSIKEFEEDRAECESWSDTESVRFHDGIIFGLKYAITVLKKYEKEGLKPCSN